MAMNSSFVKKMNTTSTTCCENMELSATNGRHIDRENRDSAPIPNTKDQQNRNIR